MTPELAEDRVRPHDPFAHFGLDTLLSGAARLRPETLALADRDETLTYAAFASRATALGHLFAEHGLKRGERIILLGGAGIAIVVALIAAIRAGLEPALAPIDLSSEELSTYARSIEASAIVGSTSYGAFQTGETLLLAAAEALSVRLVATLGPDQMDGAVDLSPGVIKQHSTSAFYTGLERGKPSATASARIFTFVRQSLTPIVHRQSTLIAAAFDFVNRAKVGRETAILSTVPPVRFAPLVAGPVSTLLSGAALHLHGPFDAEILLTELDRVGHAHLIAPAACGRDFAQAGFSGLASLTLISRLSASGVIQLPDTLTARSPLIDLYAFDEYAAVAELRIGGIAQQPASDPHYIGFENAKILAVRGLKTPAGLDLSGAAITEPS